MSSYAAGLWPLGLEKCVKFRGPCLNRSREIPPEAVASGIFDSFFRYSFRPEADNNVVYCVGMDIRIKFGDSTSNGSRDIRGAAFVSNERT